MNEEITFKISEFLERLLSLTKEDLLRSGSRLIWLDNIDRLKKQEGVYWLVSLNKEFVFDLATRDGILYLIRNYSSSDNNIVHLDLNKLPNVPCIIQVAWDCDFVELILSIQKDRYSKEMLDYKSNKKTIGTNTPIELIKWVDKQYIGQQKKYSTYEDFRRRLLEIIKGLQRKLDTYSTLYEFWNAIEIKNGKKNYTPKLEKEILPSILYNISEELSLGNIHYSFDNVIKSGNVRLIFSSTVEKIGNPKIVFEIMNAHSNDLTSELSNGFPSYMRSEKAVYGIFLVPWFKCERFDKPKCDSIHSMEFDLHGSLNIAYTRNPDCINNITPIILDVTPDTKYTDRHHMANNSSLKFSQENGLSVTYNNKKIQFGNFIGILKRNIDLTDYEHVELAKHNLKTYYSHKKLPFITTKKLAPIYSKQFINNYSPFYKYVQPEIYENFISKGKWQLGTVEQYRTIENAKQRDDFVGFSFLTLNINNHLICISFISSFNYLILSGTKSANSTFHKTSFGEKMLYIPDIKSFAEVICKEINAKKFFIQDVEYNSLKYYIVKDRIYDQYIDLRNLFTPPFFDRVIEHTFYPSLFVKPEGFRHENEVRIVFEMECDCFEPYKFEQLRLVNYISP
jgi:hypothetical protein